MLVGYFDVKSAKHCIRLLDVLQPPADDSDGEKMAAALVATVNKFGLSTANLATLYHDGSAAASVKMYSQLRELNPGLLMLDGLYGVADTACHAGVTKMSTQLQELIADIYTHYSSSSAKNEKLNELFADIPSINEFSLPPSTCCLKFCTLVRKVLGIWTDLITYYSSFDKEDDKANLICTRLQDLKLRATFMFLDRALEPLRAFQERLHVHRGSARADMVQVLQDASGLLRFYTAGFLRPQAVVRVLKECDTSLLKFHLPAEELNVGGALLEDFLCKSSEGESDTLSFVREQALSFYTGLTASLVEGLPLSYGLLRSMAQLLSPQGRLKVSGKEVVELGTKLGLCKSPEEIGQLNKEFLEYRLAEEGAGQDNASGGVVQNDCALSPEQHWSMVLKASESTSIFNKLALTLLAMPCPPLEAQQVFAQAVLSGDCAQFTDSVTESELDSSVQEEDVTDDSVFSDNKGVTVNVSKRKVKGHPRKGTLVVMETSMCCFPEVNYVNGPVKPCTVRLQKIFNGSDNLKSTVFVEDDVIWKNTAEGTTRGIFGWESSLRQKPQARTVFQAGAGVWAKPEFLDNDSRKHRESEVTSNENNSSTDSTYTPSPRSAKKVVDYQQNPKGQNRTSTSSVSSQSPRSAKKRVDYQDGKGFSTGELVWGKVKGFSWWPGLVVLWKSNKPPPTSMRRVEWFGDGMFSEICAEGLLRFEAFKKCFCKNSYASLPTYKDAIYQVLELASERCEMSFSKAGNKEEELRLMLDWAHGGFLPSGPEGFNPPPLPSAIDSKGDSSDSPLSDYQPPAKKKYVCKTKTLNGSQSYNREEQW
ncbi:hypothetical protein UPYG_G00006950 [Umbra pygmaea]|uniref:PWWP domain-containing protein n=1 Tax=Umbra pygmaea TaxID=75934 RepID=A0ABD0XHP4_UMBPY